MSQDLLLAGGVWARDSCDGDLYRKLLRSQCGKGAGGCRSSHKSIETLIVSLKGLCQSIQEQLGQENFKWGMKKSPWPCSQVLRVCHLQYEIRVKRF